MPRQNSGYRLHGLAPTHRAVHVLTERGIRAQTLQSYLSHNHRSYSDDKRQGHSKTILLLDEASMVSNQQMYDFLKSCHDTGARAVIMGDTQQLPAIEAGKPFALLQKLNIPIAELKQTERYIQGSPLKSAVTALYQGDLKGAFDQLQQDFHEEKPALENLVAMAKDYLAIPQAKRPSLQVITPSHHDRVLFNEIVRFGLKQQGELSNTTVQANVLVNRNLTQAERTEIEHYRIGDILKFHHSSGLPIAKGSYLKVAEQVPQSNALVLVDRNEQRYYWQLPQFNKHKNTHVEIYRPEPRELSVSDQIYWMQIDSAGNWLNAQLVVITHIEKDRVQAKQTDGTHITLDLSNPQHLHFDHAYAGTAHALQGITIEKISLSLRSSQKYLANQKTFLVAISRSISGIDIHTDDQTRLLERLTYNRGDKTSSIEVMDGLKQDKSNALVVERDNAKQLKNILPSVNKSLSPYNYSALAQDRLGQSLPSLLKEIMAEEPKRKTHQHYYYGHNKGSLAVSISGEKRGLWYDFQTGQGGNILQLIQMKLGLDFKRVLDDAAQHSDLSRGNIKPSEKKLTISTPTPSTINKQKGSFNQNEQARICYAQTLYAQSKTITGTLAEQYLRVHRRIQGELPDSLRYHPHVYSKINNIVAPALLAVATNQQGQVQAVQTIFLNPTTATKANLPIQKQTFGVLKGVSVTLQTKSHQVSPFIFYAEGPETGLSILSTFPRARVDVLLGAVNFKQILHQQTANHIVLCLDNDKNNNAVSKMYDDVARSLTQAGKQVWLAKPYQQGYDFNDVLSKQGQASVYQTVMDGKLYGSTEPGSMSHEFRDKMKGLCEKSFPYPSVKESKTQDPILQRKINSVPSHHITIEGHGLQNNGQNSITKMNAFTQEKGDRVNIHL